MTKRRRRRLFVLILGLGAVGWAVFGPIMAYLGVPLRWATSDHTFLFKPYLQLGDNPGLADPERAEVVWHTADQDADWWVEVKSTPDGAWVRTPKPEARRVLLEKVDPHRIYHVPIGGLKPGGKFSYRVGRGEQTLFEAEGRARMPVGMPYRTVVIGDIAAGTSAASRIAWRIGEAHPDLLVITGDIVYSRGRISEYAERFFPVYNADTPSPNQGAPILRTTLAAASPGNHDIAHRNIGSFPDILGYFLAWSQPLNGPLGTIGAPNTPIIEGPPDQIKAWLAAAGPTYPRMANFSFDFGDAHWLMLDANPHVDWSDPALRAWVERDLASVRPGAWKFAACHHPGFNSSVAHAHEQQMRLLTDLFERGGVSIVFGGHVHNYQRTYPFTFQQDGKGQLGDGHVNGVWTIDRAFDGVKQTVPKGIIYVITGGGGATLHDTIRGSRPDTRLEITKQVVSDIHSFTTLDIEPTRLHLEQINDAGAVVDAFTVTR
jgi:hypothetical protein